MSGQSLSKRASRASYCYQALDVLLAAVVLLHGSGARADSPLKIVDPLKDASIPAGSTLPSFSEPPKPLDLAGSLSETLKLGILIIGKLRLDDSKLDYSRPLPVRQVLEELRVAVGPGAQWQRYEHFLLLTPVGFRRHEASPGVIDEKNPAFRKKVTVRITATTLFGCVLQLGTRVRSHLKLSGLNAIPADGNRGGFPSILACDACPGLDAMRALSAALGDPWCRVDLAHVLCLTGVTPNSAEEARIRKGFVADRLVRSLTPAQWQAIRSPTGLHSSRLSRPQQLLLLQTGRAFWHFGNGPMDYVLKQTTSGFGVRSPMLRPWQNGRPVGGSIQVE